MRAALKWGALTGVGAYVVAQLALTFGAVLIFGSGPGDPQHPGILLSGCLGIFFILFAFSAAGYFTGRDTLKAGMGALAGMVAFAVYASLSLIYTPVTGSARPSPVPKPGSPAVSPAMEVAANITATLIILGIAALMGWLGGRPGAANARRRVEKVTAAKGAKTPA